MSLSKRLAVLLSALVLAAAAAAATPDPARTRAYIDQAWDTLTRSMDDCASLADPKLDGTPVLYLPAGVPQPDALTRAVQRCRVDVRTLPAITRLGELDASRLPPGLLYLPQPYVVPGGRFNEMYGWDSYFIVLGLIADHREALARGMVENFLFEVEHYGAVLNANRTYYLTRSQPPFLTAMIRAVLDDPASFKDAGEASAWLARAYPLVLRDYATWTRPEHRAGDTGLARYFDFGAGPVPEMKDASYYRGVIAWALAHPEQDPGYLIAAPEHPDATQAAQLATRSCDVRASTICLQAWQDGHRLRADFYRGDRAMRESGFDTNFHFGPYAGLTHHYAPVDLNSLLYRYERDLHDFALRLGKVADAQRFEQAAAARKAAIDRYLWQPALGRYCDYDFVARRANPDPYLNTFYPLWAGVASAEQARAVQRQLALFERKGGLSMSTRPSGAQWDEPFGWAPTHWLAIAGLEAYGFHDDARRLAAKFAATVDRGLAADGTIREKYDMVTGSAQVKVTAGYSENVIGFGWTNGVYLKLQELLENARAAVATH